MLKNLEYTLYQSVKKIMIISCQCKGKKKRKGGIRRLKTKNGRIYLLITNK